MKYNLISLNQLYSDTTKDLFYKKDIALNDDSIYNFLSSEVKKRKYDDNIYYFFREVYGYDKYDVLKYSGINENWNISDETYIKIFPNLSNVVELQFQGINMRYITLDKNVNLYHSTINRSFPNYKTCCLMFFSDIIQCCLKSQFDMFEYALANNNIDKYPIVFKYKGLESLRLLEIDEDFLDNISRLSNFNFILGMNKNDQVLSSLICDEFNKLFNNSLNIDGIIYKTNENNFICYICPNKYQKIQLIKQFSYSYKKSLIDDVTDVKNPFDINTNIETFIKIKNDQSYLLRQTLPSEYSNDYIANVCVFEYLFNKPMRLTSYKHDPIIYKRMINDKLKLTEYNPVDIYNLFIDSVQTILLNKFRFKLYGQVFSYIQSKLEEYEFKLIIGGDEALNFSKPKDERKIINTIIGKIFCYPSYDIEKITKFKNSNILGNILQDSIDSINELLRGENKNILKEIENEKFLRYLGVKFNHLPDSSYFKLIKSLDGSNYKIAVVISSMYLPVKVVNTYIPYINLHKNEIVLPFISIDINVDRKEFDISNFNYQTYDFENLSESKVSEKLLFVTDKVDCSNIYFNKLFSDDKIIQYIKNKLCMGDDELFDKYKKYKSLDNNKSKLYFGYGKSGNFLNECKNSVVFDDTNQNILLTNSYGKSVSLNVLNIPKNKLVLYHGTDTPIEKLKVDKPIWLSFDKKQSVLHALDNFYSLLTSVDLEDELDEDGNISNILPIVYEFSLKKNIKVINIDSLKMEELRKFYNLRLSIGDTSDYELIQLLQKDGVLVNENINGWINMDDQCQLLLFNPVEVSKFNKTYEDIIDTSKIEKLTSELLNVNDSNFLCRDYTEHGKRVIDIISKYIKNKKWSSELHLFDTNVPAILFKNDLERYVGVELCTKTDKEEYIKTVRKSLDDLVTTSITNILRPYIYKIILMIQEKIGECAKIIVAGREASNFSVLPEERTISTDIDTKLYLNFYFGEDRLKYYVSKLIFKNQFYLNTLPEIIKELEVIYDTKIYPLLLELENTFEMRVLDVKFYRPGESSAFSQRYTLLENTILNPRELDIELFAIDFKIKQMLLPSVSLKLYDKKIPKFNNIFQPNFNSYGILDMPLVAPELLFKNNRFKKDYNKYINRFNFSFKYPDNKRPLFDTCINMPMIQDNYDFDFSNLVFLNKNFELIDKQKLVDINVRPAKIQKDIDTLNSLKNTKCLTNANINKDYWDYIKCNKDQQMYDNPDIYINKLNELCKCNLNNDYKNITFNADNITGTSISKIIRYIAPIEFYGDLDIDEDPEVINKLQLDNSSLALKIFIYEKFKKGDSFNNYDANYWLKNGLLDAQPFRLNENEYKLLKPESRSSLKNQFLDSVDTMVYNVIERVQSSEYKNNPFFRNKTKLMLAELLYGFPFIIRKLDGSYSDINLNFLDIKQIAAGILCIWVNVVFSRGLQSTPRREKIMKIFEGLQVLAETYIELDIEIFDIDLYEDDMNEADDFAPEEDVVME